MIVEKPNQCAQFILDSVSDPFLILTLKVSAIIKARIIPHSENKSSRYKSNIQTSSISQPLPTGDPKLWMKTLAILSMQMFLNLLIDKKNSLSLSSCTAQVHMCCDECDNRRNKSRRLDVLVLVMMVEISQDVKLCWYLLVFVFF